MVNLSNVFWIEGRSHRIHFDIKLTVSFNLINKQILFTFYAKGRDLEKEGIHCFTKSNFISDRSNKSSLFVSRTFVPFGNRDFEFGLSVLETNLRHV